MEDLNYQHPGVNYFLVTITILGGAAAAGAYALGVIADAFSSLAFTALAVLVSAAAAVVVGFPILFLPLPSVAGFYLARFFTKKSLPSYFAFVVLGSLMVMWFVLHNFWDLNIWLAGMSLKSFCKLIVASVVLAMAVPGLALLPPKFHFLAEVGLVSHALLLCYIEDRFFNYSSIYYYGLEDDVMYPSYMVALTTFVGLALVRRLSVDNRIGPKAVWILTCLYSSKVAMLFIASKSALIRLGAAAGAVDDPTPAFPGGQTAADLASSRGRKGIAGYLAEADLTSHLLSLTLRDNSTNSVAAGMAAENAMESAAQNIFSPDRAIDEKHSLRRSLAAVRKSAHAAALLQAAFRARSFRHRQLTKSSDDISEASLDLVALGSLNKVQKVSHFDDYLHSAAIKIQQKYRGWKGRKEFLKIRNRIMKIQAHVRGHQVRKQYKKFIWSVGIVEKAILRWRRKGHGLRGFRRENTIENVVPETQKNDEYEFLRIGRKQKVAGVVKALARVQSMVRHPEACDQYSRLVTKFENFKLSNEVASESDKLKVQKEIDR